jgi:hypothetical protein
VLPLTVDRAAGPHNDTPHSWTMLMKPAEPLPTAPGALPLLGHVLPLLHDPLAFLNSLPAQGDLRPLRAQSRRGRSDPWMLGACGAPIDKMLSMLRRLPW